MAWQSEKYSSLSSIEALFDWFVTNDVPYWVLFRGFQGDRKNRSDCICQNKDVSDKERSWDILNKNIQMQSEDGGKFTVFVSEKANGNYGFTTFLKLSNQAFITNNKLPGLPQASSIQGMPFSIGGVEKYVDERIAATQREMQLQFDMKQLEAENQALKNRTPDSIGGKIGDALLQDPLALIDKIAGFIAMVRNVNPTGITAVSGGPPVTDDEHSISEPISTEDYTRRIAIASERIRKHVDVLILLENLADLMEHNPQKVIAFLTDKEKLTQLTAYL